MRAALVTLLLIATTAHGQDVALKEIVTGLESPVALAHAGDPRLFIVLQNGRVVIHDRTQILPAPFLDIRHLVHQGGGERGLLGLAFHPEYADNGFLYVYYTDLLGDLVIARFEVTENPNLADAGSVSILLTIPHRTYGNHNGGQLAFGPDGYLYAGPGDGGGGGDPLDSGQDLDTLLGKIVRIDVDGDEPYAIPATNPFVGVPGARPEIWAYGLRNPWRFSFDRQNGDLFIADVGQGSWEEVNHQAAASLGGENYGWKIMEGDACYSPSTGCDQTGLTVPVIVYGHTSGNCSVTGGYRYRGAMFSRLQGLYIHGDYCSGRIWGADADWNVTPLRDTSHLISSFGEDWSGELYVLHHGGALYQIEDQVAPVITSLSPESGTTAGGDTVTIHGSGLGNPHAVTFGGAAATVVSSTASSITVTTPSAPAPGPVDVVVTVAGGSTTASGAFLYESNVPADVAATAIAATLVRISWSPAVSATGYQIERSDGAMFEAGGSPYDDATVVPDTAYLYRVRATTSSGTGPPSAYDLATTVMYSDEPLAPQVTPIRAEHIQQLRTAVNAVRAVAGLEGATFDSPLTIVRAVHVQELRDRLDEARPSAGLPASAYTDVTLIPGSTPIRAVHVSELRNAMR